jgi:hypothetical protein
MWACYRHATGEDITATDNEIATLHQTKKTRCANRKRQLADYFG